MRGRFEWEKLTTNGLKVAIAYFQQAIQQDPACAQAHVEMARAYGLMAALSGLPMAEASARARAAVLRAVAIDDTSGAAHFVLGGIKWQADWDSPGAEAEFRRGLELDPSFESLMYDHWLSAHGRHDEAIAEARRVVALNPTALPNLMVLVRLPFAGRNDEALLEAGKLRDMYPGAATSYVALGAVHLHAGRYQEAEAALRVGEDRSRP